MRFYQFEKLENYCAYLRLQANDSKKTFITLDSLVCCKRNVMVIIETSSLHGERKRLAEFSLHSFCFELSSYMSGLMAFASNSFVSCLFGTGPMGFEPEFCVFGNDLWDCELWMHRKPGSSKLKWGRDASPSLAIYAQWLWLMYMRGKPYVDLS